MTNADLVKLALMFVNGFAAFIAAAPQEIDPAVRIVCAALAAACGICLAFMEKVGADQKKVSADRLTAAQTRQVADEIERRMKSERS